MDVRLRGKRHYQRPNGGRAWLRGGTASGRDQAHVGSTTPPERHRPPQGGLLLAVCVELSSARPFDFRPRKGASGAGLQSQRRRGQDFSSQVLQSAAPRYGSRTRRRTADTHMNRGASRSNFMNWPPTGEWASTRGRRFLQQQLWFSHDAAMPFH